MLQKESFRKNIKNNLEIRLEILQYEINREAAKISAFLSAKIDKYKNLTGEEILASDQSRTIEETKYRYCLAIEKKERKTNEEQGKKQVEALEVFKPNTHKKMFGSGRRPSFLAWRTAYNVNKIYYQQIISIIYIYIYIYIYNVCICIYIYWYPENN